MNNEPTPTNFLLIDGVFSTDDARNVLMTLINNKIQFHEQDSWSRKERFGDSHAAGSRRVDQLLQTRTDLATLIDHAQSRGERLSISCTIEVTRVPE
ncbi:hypothetical protein [Saccharospirillum alexandrii]|uniref:hypothetical protein n=1 Tax=Saccharospirillum alexandrii TaxID=2448477 RepID=UPI003734D83E